MQYPGESTETTLDAAPGAGGGIGNSPLTLVIPGPSLAVGGKIRESHLAQFGVLGLTLPDDMTYERWCDLLRMLRYFSTAGDLYLADVITRGVELFGQERVSAALGQMEFNFADAERAVAIGQLAPGVRHVALTKEHYWVLSKAKLTPEAQVHWAALAVEHEISAPWLATSIIEGKVMKPSAGEKAARAALASIHASRQNFDTWFAQMESVDLWDLDRKRQVWEELSAPTKLGVRLARELGIEL